MAGMGKLIRIALFVSLASPAWAQADSVTLFKSALWSAYTTKTQEGRGLCGIGTSLVGGRSLYVKWIEGSGDLVVQVFKPGLAIPRGVISNLVLRMGEAPARTVRSVPLDRRADFVEVPIGMDGVREFTREFTAARTMNVEFADGGDRPWDVDLTGNSGAVDALVKCVGTVAGAGHPTDPFAYARR